MHLIKKTENYLYNRNKLPKTHIKYPKHLDKPVYSLKQSKKLKINNQNQPNTKIIDELRSIITCKV
jgi:hypothetical protein